MIIIIIMTDYSKMTTDELQDSLDANNDAILRANKNLDKARVENQLAMQTALRHLETYEAKNTRMLAELQKRK